MATITQPEVRREVADFLLEEYRSHEAAIWESERTGETRVNFFLTVTAAIFAALLFDDRVLMARADTMPRLPAVAVLVALLVFGRVTLARVVHRNLQTDREIESARRIRRYFVSMEPTIAQYVSRSLDLRKTRERLGLGKLVTRGGLVETVMLWNALIAAILFGLFGLTGARRLQAREVAASFPALSDAMALTLAVIGLLLAWWMQQHWVNSRYDLDEGRRSAGRPGSQVG